MARRTIIAGNWKMNLSRSESVDLARQVAAIEHDAASTALAIFPATTWLVPVADALTDTNLGVGAQNCHFEPKGAFTGEVSAAMLSEVCDYTMAGHSERRHVFGETDEVIGKKVRAILDAGMQVVLCVGETLEEREAEDAETIVERQMRLGLEQVGEADLPRIVIAYEPVWAIGTGVSASPDDAQAMCAFVRSMLSTLYGASNAAQRPVLYGGSVTGDNARDLLGQADIDGGLVGGASLDVQSFRAIVQASQSM